MSDPGGSDELYVGGGELAGAIEPGTSVLTLRSVIADRDRRTLIMLLAGNVACTAVLISVVLLMAARLASRVEEDALALAGIVVLTAIATADALRLVQTVGLGAFAFAMKDPVPMAPVAGTRVAVLTTIVPSQEPVDVVARTLEAMSRLHHDGVVDAWILDEEDDPAVRSLVARLGVRHFSRAGRPEYNTPCGVFRAATKAGNHNAWQAEHGQDYDLVAQVDPDHVPRPGFLQRTVGYFRDPDVAFVVAPQVYGNAYESWIARAAAAQGYVFAGVVQRGGNAFGAPLLIGTNHVYRMSAWQQIGGYQDSLIEDHLTGMVVEGTINPATGRTWRGVYTPDILAVGEGPATWADFFRQQQRWSAGVWEIIRTHRTREPLHLNRRQRAAYVFLQSFYPTIGISWLVGVAATIAYLSGLGAVPPSGLGLLVPIAWAGTVVSWLALFTWLRAWNLQPHERHESVLRSWAVTLLTAPVYASSALRATSRKRGRYHVTGKGALRRKDGIATFRTQLWTAAILVSALAFGYASGLASPIAVLWSVGGLVICLAPLPIALIPLRRRRGPWRAPSRSRDRPGYSRPARRPSPPGSPRPAPRAPREEAGSDLRTPSSPQRL